MSHGSPLKITVENLGPIVTGDVELKPLTILVGRNNSGKTYFAQLLYSIFKSFRDRVLLSPYKVVDGSQQLPNRALYGYLGRVIQTSSDVVLSDIPEGLRTSLMDNYRSIANNLESAMDVALHDYFGVSNLGDIIRNNPKRRPLSVRINNTMLSLSVKPGESPAYDFSPTLPTRVFVSRDDLDSLKMAGLESTITDWANFLATKMWLAMLEENNLPMKTISYIPAYRSGLLQSWDMIFRFSLRLFTLDWLRSNFPQLTTRPTGVLFDFLDEIFTAGTAPPGVANEAMQPAIDLLEREILEGNAFVGDITKGESLVNYQQGKQSYPLSLSSSMFAELASLDILLRRKIRPGDFVIIDEPEAHLHPENQRLIARVVVRLVRTGVRVVCPTHSSLFLHQVSNHLLASSASSEVWSALGFTDSDLISQEDVGVYLFSRSRGGTQIHPVPIEPGFGILEDEFLRVVEEIGAESFTLSDAALSSHSVRS